MTDTVFTGTVTIGLGSYPDSAALTGSGYTFIASAISFIGASTSFTVQ